MKPYPPRAARLLILLLAFAATALSFPTAHASTSDPAPDAATPPLVILGTAGVRWSQVDQTNTPGLWELAEYGSIAANVSRAQHRVSQPTDGWAALSHGRRGEHDPVLWPSLRAAGLRAHGFGALTEVALSSSDAQPGVAAQLDLNPLQPTQVPDLLRQSLLNADLVLLDAGSDLRTTDEITSQVIQTLWEMSAERAGPDQIRLIVISLADDGKTAQLQLAGEIWFADGRVQGTPALLRGVSTRHGALVQSIDVLPLVLSHFEVANVGAAASGTAWENPGRPASDNAQASQQPSLRVPEESEVTERLATVTSLEAHAHGAQVSAPVFMVLHRAIAVGLILLGLRVLWTAVGRGAPARLTVLKRRSILVALVATVCAHPASYLTNLVPWWRLSAPASWLVWLLVLLVGTGAFTWLVLRPWWGRSRFAVAGVSGLVMLAVLGADLWLGARLSLAAPLGSNPLDAGRFYGFNNAAFALFLVSVFLVAVWLVDLLRARARPGAWVWLRGPRLVCAALVGSLAVLAALVDAAPQFGADVGGAPAVLLTGALFALWLAGVKVRWRHLWASLGLGLVLLIVLGWLDYLRPDAERTHLGRFVADLLAGPEGGALGTVWRKVQVNLLIAGLTLLVISVGLVLAWLVARAARGRFGDYQVIPFSGPWWAQNWLAVKTAGRNDDLLRQVALSVAAGLILGSLLNDSGLHVFVTGGLFAAPVLLVVGLLAAAHPRHQGVQTTADRAAGAAHATRSDG